MNLGASVHDVPDVVRQEEDRVRTAYARRHSGELYSWLNPAHVFAMQERERRVLQLIASGRLAPLGERRILDVGCGTGQWLRDFVRWGARPEQLVGVDLLAERVEEARRLCPPGIQVECGSATHLPFPAGEFDIVLQSTVFTSVLAPAVRQMIAAEMQRVLRPGGAVLWYDFRVSNPRNQDVRGVGRREIRDLFPGCLVRLRSITLAPPLTRRLAFRAPILCHVLERVPWLRTHYLGLIVKPAGTLHARA